VVELVGHSSHALCLAVRTPRSVSEHASPEVSPLGLAVESMVMVIVGLVPTLGAVC
jgi:hypothetical protein